MLSKVLGAQLLTWKVLKSEKNIAVPIIEMDFKHITIMQVANYMESLIYMLRPVLLLVPELPPMLSWLEKD